MVDWARSRLEKAKDKGKTSEIVPHFVNLYGPDGSILKRIRVDPQDGATTDVTDEARNNPSRQLPPLFPALPPRD
jgi:hypothetical protein